MPEFVNANKHRVYVQKPGEGLIRLLSRESVSGDGLFADKLEQTPGVYLAKSDAAKKALATLDVHDAKTQGPGPDAFPLDPEYQSSNDSATQDLDELKKDDLVALASERGIELPAKATKAEVVEAIKAAGPAVLTTDKLPDRA